MLLVVGCSFRDTPIAMRERLAFDEAKVQRALDELNSRFGCESVILSTCNRVELYLARADAPIALDTELSAEFLTQFHQLPAGKLVPHLYVHDGAQAVRQCSQWIGG